MVVDCTTMLLRAIIRCHLGSFVQNASGRCREHTCNGNALATVPFTEDCFWLYYLLRVRELHDSTRTSVQRLKFLLLLLYKNIRKGDWITFSLPSWLLLTRASYLPLHLPNISWCNLDLLSSSTSTSFLTYNLLYLCCGCTIIASQFVLIYTPLTSIDNITSAVIALHIVLLRKLSNVINIKLHNPAMTRYDEHWEGGLWMLGFWLQRQSALPSG